MRKQVDITCGLCKRKTTWVSQVGMLQACPKCYRLAFKLKISHALHEATAQARADPAPFIETDTHVKAFCTSCGKPFTRPREEQPYWRKAQCNSCIQDEEGLAETMEAQLVELADYVSYTFETW